ncbi:MAG: hypothetical protein IT472_02685 [Thermomonas sp.]|uniref:pilus assembly PilX family protein n=1 Tax=Thermomonas sp. TaxID=1971895 RepID=UPI00261EC017|nr:PilX N-terminal domain-containing pilus assembly protein [Thermomonas sp.]MCC7096074.1 hypothetical protein [Thermomonas sp.]
MNRTARCTIPAYRGHQQGVSLLVVLVLLIVMSVLGIAVLRSSAMQERMAANLYDRSLAFQAAETALRQVQNAVLGNPAIVELQYGKTLAELRADGLPLDCAGHGFCNQDSNSGTIETPVRMSDSYTAADGKVMPFTYTLEYLGTGKGSMLLGICETTYGQNSYQCQRPMFRATVRGQGPGHALVVLQANIVSR